MGKDIAHPVEGMDLLQEGFSAQYAAARAAKPSGRNIRVGRLKLQGTDPEIDAAIDEALAKAGFQVVQLDDQFRQKWDEAKANGNTVAASGASSINQAFLLAPGVSARTKNIISLGGVTGAAYTSAGEKKAARPQTTADVFQKGDLNALPTKQKPPPGFA